MLTVDSSTPHMKLTHHFLSASLLLTTLGAGLAQTSQAQTLRTGYFMETSKFAHQLNPALLESRPYTAFPILGNVSVDFNASHPLNTFFYKRTDASGSTHYDSFSSSNVPATLVQQRLGNKDVTYAADFNENILSFATSGLGGTTMFEVNLRATTSVEIPNQLFQYTKLPEAQEIYQLDHLRAKHQSYAEIALGYANTVGNHFTIGGKVKALLGFSYADIEANNIRVNRSLGHWAASGQASAAAALGNTDFLFTNDGRFNDIGDIKPSIAGYGAALDLGLTYEVHGLEGLTLSAAVTDLGFLSYNEAHKMGQKVNRTWTIAEVAERAANYAGTNVNPSAAVKQELDADLSEILALNDEGVSNATASLRTTLHLGAQYSLPFVKHFNVGVLYSRYFGNAFAQSKFTLGAAWRPVKAIELGVSTTHSNNNWSLGTMLTLQAPHFQFFVGTDAWPSGFSLDGLLASRAANVNLGFTFPLK